MAMPAHSYGHPLAHSHCHSAHPHCHAGPFAVPPLLWPCLPILMAIPWPILIAILPILIAMLAHLLFPHCYGHACPFLWPSPGPFSLPFCPSSLPCWPICCSPIAMAMPAHSYGHPLAHSHCHSAHPHCHAGPFAVPPLLWPCLPILMAIPWPILIAI